jgi:hypothetical protein
VSTLTTDELSQLVGVPETRLPERARAQLPTSTPGAPWRVRMSALLWRHKTRSEASEAVPSALDVKAQGITNAGFIRYHETPVGPYSEVMAAVSVRGGLLPRAHIPFIAVDSVPSVHGGRAHWALPKVLAHFSWNGANDVTAKGDEWWMSARVIGTGPRIPLFGRSTTVQVRPDGRIGVASTAMRGWGRVVTLDVDVDRDASFASWVRPGRHRGIYITAGRLSMGPARWS